MWLLWSQLLLLNLGITLTPPGIFPLIPGYPGISRPVVYHLVTQVMGYIHFCGKNSTFCVKIPTLLRYCSVFWSTLPFFALKFVWCHGRVAEFAGTVMTDWNNAMFMKVSKNSEEFVRGGNIKFTTKTEVLLQKVRIFPQKGVLSSEQLEITFTLKLIPGYPKNLKLIPSYFVWGIPNSGS